MLKGFFFMDIRLKIGRYAGEIRDFPADVARRMIDDDLAMDPRFEGELPAQPAFVLVDELHKQPAPVAEVHVPEVRRRRNRGN